MNRYLLSLIFVCTGFQLVFAQLDSFNIADYARPDLERRTAGLFGTLDMRKPNTFDPTTEINRSIDLDFNAFQTKFVNTQRNQINVTNRINIDYLSGKLETNTSETKRQAFDFYGTRTYSNKIFNAENNFVEIAYNGGISYSAVNQEYFTFDTLLVNIESNTRSLYLSGDVSLYRGHGRIELVSDAWHAKTIIEMLRAKNLIVGEVSVEDIQEFAEKISDIKNMRNTDFRLENIAEQEALVEFLQSKEWTRTEDFRFYPALLDAWQFESFVFRQSGSEFKYGISAGVNAYNIDNSILLRNSDYRFLVYPRLSVAYNTYKPISDDWQFNTTNGLSLGSLLRNFDSFTDDLYAAIASSLEWQYLPSQRTYYTLGLETNLLFPFDEGAGTSILSPYATYVHYLSPRFNISVRGQIFIRIDLNELDFSTRSESLRATASYRFY